MTCNCLIELAHVFLEKTFTYLVPDNLKDEVKVGVRVKVPFGKQLLEGFVMEINNYDGDISALKEVTTVVDSYPVLNDELLELGKFVKNITLSSLMSSYQVMLPKALKAKDKVNIKIKKDKYYRLNDISLEDFKFNQKQQEIVDFVSLNKMVLKKKLEEISPSSLKTLVSKGVLVLEEREVYRYNLTASEKKDFVLNEEQFSSFSKVKASFGKSDIFLLYGVTGSGKTNVYMKLIEEVINQGKTALFLVPEISLTPQIISRFTSYFDKIAVLHSRLSDSEKYDEWRKINEGKVNIVVGARSAVFAPLKNIGIIIIDEEHTSSYKQENNPRYNAVDIAKFRSNYHKCPLVLGSATPMIESYTRALKGEYTLLKLKNRYNKMSPLIEVIDMNEEFKKTNNYFSKRLIEEIKNRIEKDEQAILFLNKRGYSKTVTCLNCRETIKCPKCDISLTYHKTSNMLRCHYCGYAEAKKEKCPVCKSEYKEYGLGTEKVKEVLEELLEDAKIVRMDIDTTSTKGAHKRIIEDFANKKYNILLGTQMIAKGLDFENVTLVGIIDADSGLNFPDFRSSEIAFSLLNQVSGRSGRGEKRGLVLIQTFNKDHYAIKYSIMNDYEKFYEEEFAIRKKLGYPPFCYICLIRIISKDYDLVSKMSSQIGNYLKSKITNEVVLGPSTANIFKLNNEYRFQIIIKYKDIKNIRKYLIMLEERFLSDKKIKLEIDFNPLKL